MRKLIIDNETGKVLPTHITQRLNTKYVRKSKPESEKSNDLFWVVVCGLFVFVTYKLLEALS